jgi:tetratricopeptide (TPR) repeat protein
MSRLTKKQLQTDQLQHALVDARDFVASHRGQTAKWAVAGGGALILVGAVWGGFTLRERRLEARFSSALALFDAPLVTDGDPVSPGQKVFKDAAERRAAARTEIKGIAKDAPSSRSGRKAAVMLLSLEGPAGATAANLDAAKAFALQGKGSVAGGVAAVLYLDAQAAAGRTKEAIDTAKAWLDARDAPAPKDLLIFTLARLTERAGQPAEAKTYYQRLVTDYPDSPFRGDAQQRLQSL